MWSSKDFKPVKTLSGHEDKLASLDVVAGTLSETIKWISLPFYTRSNEEASSVNYKT